MSVPLSPLSKIHLLICRCPLCTPPVVEQTDNQVQAFDNTHLEKINRGKKPPPSSNGHRQRPSSSKKSSKRQSETDQTWTTLRNNYLQVLVLTNATLWSFAPQGLSKLSHMADGLLDLILIAPTSKKDFVRYLKRNGNSKNQVRERRDKSFFNNSRFLPVRITIYKYH